MFESKTVLVLGAGASVDFGLPTGHDLKSRISRALDIRFDGSGTIISGEFRIYEALKILARQFSPNSGSELNSLIKSAWAIRDALPQSISIDNFIDAHRGDKKISDVGKLGIATCILEAERSSILSFDQARRQSPDFARLESTWIASFFKMMTSEVQSDNVQNSVANLSVISFNYDRCFEHFLRFAFQNYYRIDNSAAETLARNLPVMHPYGQVGNLPWQANEPVIHFGHQDDYNSRPLMEASAKLRIFTEQIEDPAVIDPMRLLVQNAESIVFLGFAFHRQNLDLIAAKSTPRAKRVFATTYGMSPFDGDAVRSDIRRWLGSDRAEIVLYDGKCADFFNDFSRVLPRSVH
jgi:hypothetical protein